ncbi:mercury resistance system periplasmic binding protein MerP [Edaphobacter bradus]|uniref:mercury resistance system periplasmic binding protein MerP n=1 Tax=Edaphobacter bradus TaxID=2259016 RepID=UPI0021DFFFF6|nr:mercury resistance system periplasmic binding protein MerP [Edaphobacter bradus]
MRKALITAFITISLTAFAASQQTIVLDVPNMTCPVCPITIKKALKRVPGVEDATVNYDKKTVTVKYDPEKASPAALIKATTDAGFPSSTHNAPKS